MDFEQKKFANANYTTDGNCWLSEAFFFWVFPLLRKGSTSAQPLTRDDLQSIPEADRSSKVGDALESAWDTECLKANKMGRRPRLFNALLSVFGIRYFVMGILIAVDELVLRVGQSLLLKWLVEAFANGESMEMRYLYAGGVCLTSVFHALLIHPVYFVIQRIGMDARVAASSLIYRKALRLKLGTVTDSTIGQAINLLSNDLSRFDTCLYNIPCIIIGIVQAGILIWFLWIEMGISTFAGTGFFLIFLPLQYFVGSCSRKYRNSLARKTDARASVMNQVIDAIRVIKMYAWEMTFSEKIQLLRKAEISTLWQSKFVRSLSVSLYQPIPKISTCLTLVTYHLTGNTLTSSKVFFLVSVFNVLRQTIAVSIPEAAAELGELLAVASRVGAFLLLEEKDTVSLSSAMSTGTSSTIAKIQFQFVKRIAPEIRFCNASARWAPDENCLDNINLHLSRNQLVFVIGSVGSGKSTLLHTIMKELPTVTGSCSTIGKIAYSSQVPWIFSGTIKQNILLGLPYDETKFKTVTEVCGLKEDLKQFLLGIFTQVGDKGTSLSGGQKARVNFARALYQGGEIILMDDILSALDSRVGRHVFNEAIVKYLGSSLRVLATHQVQFLPQADYIVVLDQGQIQFQGTYEQLLTSGIDLSYIIDKPEQQSETQQQSEIEENYEAAMIADYNDNDPVSGDTNMLQEHKNFLDNFLEAIPEEGPSASLKNETPNVQKALYWNYYRSGNSKCTLFWLLTLFIFSQCLYSFVEIWLANWTTSVEHVKPLALDIRNASVSKVQNFSTQKLPLISADIYLWTYVGVTVGLVVLTIVRTIWFYWVHLNISHGIHNKMFNSLMRAPTMFYDKNSSGRIMNRFTKDLGTIDELLPSTLLQAASIIIMMFGILFSVIASNYYLAIPSLMFLIVLWMMRNFYLKSSRTLKHLEAQEKSPVYTHLSGSFNGLATIRASRCEHILIHQFDGLQDNHSAAWYAYISTSRWFGYYLELLSVGFLILVTVPLLLLSTDSSNGTWLGLAISSVLGLSVNFQFGMRQSAEADNMMTSVERALEYTVIEPEAPLESSPDFLPPSNWPAEGQIKFKNVSLSYCDKRVLKHLSFTIPHGSKIGIVGRTGAGKSSIISALFRMTEPSGSIFIDGCEIGRLGLHDLRPRISIIPQDPTLFSGTIRYNLDPFSEYGDDQIWKALAAVELSHKVHALDHLVTEGGGNFSVGERQLICLGRTLLRKNKILVLDEMTANIDARTEELIQKTIEEKFSGCTVLTIAHRLSTIMNSDLVLVLSHGEVMEYDSPANLLANPNGLFRSMVPRPGNSNSTSPAGSELGM